MSDHLDACGAHAGCPRWQKARQHVIGGNQSNLDEHRNWGLHDTARLLLGRPGQHFAFRTPHIRRFYRRERLEDTRKLLFGEAPVGRVRLEAPSQHLRERVMRGCGSILPLCVAVSRSGDRCPVLRGQSRRTPGSFGSCRRHGPQEGRGRSRGWTGPPAARLPVANPPCTTSSVTHGGAVATGVREPTCKEPSSSPAITRPQRVTRSDAPPSAAIRAVCSWANG